MKFLVIGGSGFVGRHLLAHLEDTGYPALGTQSTSKKPGLVTFDLFKDRIEDRVGAEFFASDEPVVGVITAAISKLDQCFQEPETARAVNVTNTIQLIQDLLVLGIKPVFLSSNCVFDGEIGYDNEERPRHPINEYGRHKAEVECFIEDHAPDALVLRLDKVVGDNPNDDHPFSEWYEWILNSKPVTCIEGQVLAPTDVKDVARGIVLSCQMGISGFYNMANSEFFTREDLARQFVFTLGRDAKIVSKPMKEFNFLDPRPLKCYLDSTKFVNATGMRFTSMREVINSFIQNAEGLSRQFILPLGTAKTHKRLSSFRGTASCSNELQRRP